MWQARQQVLEEKKKILDTQLQIQKQTLAKTGGIEQLEEERRRKDAEMFAQYFSEQFYIEDEEDFEVVGAEEDEEEYESQEDDQDLSSLISSMLSPTESRTKPQPFNIPQLKLPLRESFMDVQTIELDEEEEEEEEEDLSSLISALVRN